MNVARRFVAGEHIEDAIAAVRRLNDRGMSASIDFLGEDVHSTQGAIAVRGEYLLLLDALAEAGARSNVSVKLTALGLLVDRGVCSENLRAIVTRASDTTRRSLIDPFVRIDMEGSALTETTLQVFEDIFTEQKNVGIVLQAYLHRSAADVARAIALGARVRLCKGAYKEPAQIAIHDMPSIRRALYSSQASFSHAATIRRSQRTTSHCTKPSRHSQPSTASPRIASSFRCSTAYVPICKNG